MSAAHNEATDSNVAIIGAGLAGLALAIALRNSGIDGIALFDQQASPSQVAAPASPVMLAPNATRVLRALGLRSQLDKIAYAPRSVQQRSGTSGFLMSELPLGDLAQNRYGAPYLVADYTALRSALRAQAEHLGVRVEYARTCVGRDQQRAVFSDASSHGARLLVAADGALSRVRDMMAFPTREWAYGHRAIVTTVQVEHSHRDTCWQRFLTSGPLAFLPLPGEDGRHYCSIVWSLREELVDDLLALEDQAFCDALEQAIEARLGKVMQCAPRFAFPLRQRHAIDYVQAGVALVGDAAHTIHPLAGQGINLGLQDVAVLAEEVLAGHAKGVDPGQLALLGRYQRRRKGENLLMMAAMDGFKALFEQQALPVRWLRNAGMRGVNQIGPLKQQLIRRAMGVG